MAIGRTFKAGLWKGIRSLETGKAFGSEKYDKSLIANKLITPTPDRLNYIRFAMASGYSVADIPRDDVDRPVVPGADEGSGGLRGRAGADHARDRHEGAVSRGQAVRHQRRATGEDVGRGRNRMCARGARSWASRRCSAAWTRARRSSKASRPISIRPTRARARPIRATGKKVMILGSGPNRIGQGIEFDYCCCHASFRAAGDGRRIDHGQLQSGDGVHRLRHQRPPVLRAADARRTCSTSVDTEKPDGVIVQFGGQTPLNLALPLKRLGVPIIGTDPENIDLAEDRKLFGKLLDELKIPCPANGTATSVEEACAVARAHRISGAGASQLRAGRARHGDRLRRGDGAAVHARGGDVLAGSSGAGGSLPGRRHRSGRGRAGRWRRTC